MNIKKDQRMGKILGIRLNGTYLVEVLKEITSRLAKKQKTFIVTPNPEFIVYAQRHPWFARILNSADIAIPDGIGLVWAARILNQPRLERVTGADIVSKLFLRANQNSWQIGLVGARRGDTRGRKKLAAKLSRKYPRVKIFILEDTPNWQQKRFELVFACQGMGKQEKWIWDNLQKTEGFIFMGAGGALDYLAGFVPRAPVWIRKLGLEWLYRLFRQPWRLRRQLALVKFIWLILKEKFSPANFPC